MKRTRYLVRAAAAVAALSLAATSCSSSSSTGTTTPSSGALHGTAAVAYAGSLVKLYNDTLGPAFAKATGDHFGGPPGAGSTALAQEILSDEISPGVFMAVGSKPIQLLWPARSKFALSLGTDPLVVAFSSKSLYAKQLSEIASGKLPLKNLYGLLATPGFRLGRTDPSQDPQGAFFILMMKLAQAQLSLAAGEADKALGITSSAPFGSKSQILDETALPTDISTGVVDAGSEYLSQALQYHLDYIALPADLNFATPADTSIYATVSIPVAGTPFQGKLISLEVTLVSPPKGQSVTAANQAADDAFVAFLLSTAGRSILSSSGYKLGTPTIELAAGSSSASEVLPAAILAPFEALKGVTKTS
jgi:molybdate/tungstate transport system substrate-binding protein